MLNRKNIEYNQVVVDPSMFENYKKQFNVETLPLLLHGEEKVGGYDDTLNLLRDSFDYDLLHKVTKVVTRNLNNVIDINFYPTDKTKNSNMKHRPYWYRSSRLSRCICDDGCDFL